MHHRDGPKATAEHPPVLIKAEEAGILLYTEAGVEYGGSRWGLEADKHASCRPGALSPQCRPVMHLDGFSVKGVDDSFFPNQSLGKQSGIHCEGDASEL